MRLAQELLEQLDSARRYVSDFIPRDDLRMLASKPRGSRLALSPPSERAEKLGEYLLLCRYVDYVRSNCRQPVDFETYRRLHGRRIMVSRVYERKDPYIIRDMPDDVAEWCVWGARLGKPVILYPDGPTSQLLMFYVRNRVPGAQVTVADSETKQHNHVYSLDVYWAVLEGRLTRDEIARRINREQTVSS